jgi:hypothetical protein
MPNIIQGISDWQSTSGKKSKRIHPDLKERPEIMTVYLYQVTN